LKGSLYLAALAGMVAWSQVKSLPGKDPARADAIALARDVIRVPQGPSGRLSQFLTWSTRADMNPCPAQRDRSFQLSTLRAATAPGLHNGASGNFGSLGFYYNLAAEQRLCQPATREAGAPVIMTGKVTEWWQMRGKTPDRIDPVFPAGSRAAVAMWSTIAWGAPTASIAISVRTGAQTSATRNVTIDIPDQVLKTPPVCGAPLSAPAHAAAPPGARTLNDFFWVQLQKGDVFDQGNCGDFLLLVGLHVIEKKPDRWLWSTFWWDPDSTGFSTKDVGGLPGPWRNYAMDAAYGMEKIIFSPWKRNETTNSNCEFCHQRAVSPGDGEPAGHTPPAPLPFGRPVLGFDFIFAGSKMQR
jgi:hypothetical protein